MSAMLGSTQFVLCLLIIVIGGVTGNLTLVAAGALLGVASALAAR